MTGTLLHTGLGRARLAPTVADAVAEAAGSHVSVELDLESGQRGDRIDSVRSMLQDLTGAEDAHVVNNCAAGVLLALAAFGTGREVVLSRTQMVEIGGSYRMPEIVQVSGAKLVEVGCTNKVHLADYARAITPQTGAILTCHRSNFELKGFTEEPTPREVSSLAHAHNLPHLDDLGSGCFVDTTAYGLRHERTVQEALADEADLVMFSGDKLLGGPQAGVICGSSAAIQKLKKHPMARALRVDKLTLAALHATLRLYLQGKHEELPLYGALARSVEHLEEIVEKLLIGEAKPVNTTCEIGGGSLPGQVVPSMAVVLSDPEAAARFFRSQPTPMLGYIQHGAFFLDVRALDAAEIPLVQEALHQWNRIQSTYRKS